MDLGIIRRLKLSLIAKIIRKEAGSFIKRHTRLSIIAVYDIIFIIAAIIFYPVLPRALNYSPDSYQYYWRKWTGLSYFEQYSLIVFLVILIGTIFLLKILSDIDNWRKLSDPNNSHYTEEIRRFRKKYMNMHYKIYTAWLLFPLVIAGISQGVIIYMARSPFLNLLKVITLIFSYTSLTGIVALIFTKNVFEDILTRTCKTSSLEGGKIGLKSKIFLQIFPMFIVAILFTSLLGYSSLVNEKGNLLFRNYKDKLIETFKEIHEVHNMNQLKGILNQLEETNEGITGFIVTPSGNITMLDGSFMDAGMVNYLNDLSETHDGRVYNYSSEIQGATIRIKGDGGYWTAGVQYQVASNEAVNSFLTGFIVLLFLNAIILLFFSRSLTGDISTVARSLSEIAEGSEVSLERRIAVTSNDEIGDLVVAFNSIQDHVKDNIKSIKEAHEMLMERERLASLGQLIGGIAHNINTPIMSIAGGLEALQDLASEYDESIGDENVTKEDHHEIAAEILDWVKKIKPYCAYMSDVIAAVKGQAVHLSDSTTDGFTLGELVKRVEILMNSELKRHKCRISIDLSVDTDIELRGEVNSLVQVINNLIMNAIDAYKDEEGVIYLKIDKKGDGKPGGNEEYIEFAVKDYGSGIPEEVQQKLLREMVTTKGKDGTGLGLFMSYSTIRGRFGGDMRFESEEGKGTTFYVMVPYRR